MKWFIRGYSLILLAYTGYRTWHFVSRQLPPDATGFWLAILFLFATEAGLLIWHEVSISHTTTYTQHGIAVFLTWLDFAASLGAGTADMILLQTIDANYTIPGWLASALIFGLPIIVAVNVAGALVFQANDAEAQLDRAKRFLIFEAGRQALKDLGNSRGALAREQKRQIIESVSSDAIKQISQDHGELKKNAINGNSSKQNAIKAAETVAPPELQPNPTKAGKRKP